jgi:hypothetical protein
LVGLEELITLTFNNFDLLLILLIFACFFVLLVIKIRQFGLKESFEIFINFGVLNLLYQPYQNCWIFDHQVLINLYFLFFLVIPALIDYGSS